MTIPTTTRHWYYPSLGNYKNLKLKESQIPDVGPTDVLVKIHATSLQYRDFMISSGTYSSKIADELTPLSDGAGEIIAVGDRVTKWKTGDRVCANFSTDHIYGKSSAETFATSLGGPIHGVLSEYKVFPAHSLVKIPEHFSYEEAATLPCAALTAYNALHGPNQIKAGDTVLVQGTGGVSIFGLQFAVSAGATVLVTSSSDEKLAIAKKLGATHLINYTKTPDWDAEARRLTDGLGVDHILEVGGAGTLEKSLSAAAFGGNIYIIGALAGKNPTSDNPVNTTILYKSLNIRGILIGSVAQFNDMNRLIAANPEKTKPVIDKVFGFNDVIQAFEHLESQKHVGKIVIKVAQQ